MKTKQRKFLLFQLVGLVLLCLYAFPKKDSTDFTAVDRFDALLSDLKFRVRGPKKASGEVIVVAIDRPSIEALGHWPWKRNAISLLTESLFKLGIKNVGYDIGFIEINVADNNLDREFASTLKAHRDSITLSWWTLDLCGKTCSGEKTEKLPPHKVSPAFPKEDIWQFENPELNHKMFSIHVPNQGFGNSTKDPDGQARSAYYYLRDSNGIYPSLPLALISQRLGQPAENLVTVVHSPIDYLGPAGTIPRHSALELMQLASDLENPNKRNREVAEVELPLEGKTAIIGVTTFGLVDEQVSPFDRAIHGVEIQASIADQILRQDCPIQPKVAVWVFTVLFSVLLLGSTLFLRTSGIVGSFWITLGLSYAIDFHLLFPRGIFCPTALLYANITLVALSTLSGRFYDEFRQRQFLKDAFSKYLAPDVVKILLTHPDSLKLGGEKKEITTLFCDLRDFTALSEKLEPQELTQVLNETFTVLTSVIFKHQGTVDKYIGDALMAFFGAPLEQPDHAYRACMAAQEMVKEFNKKKVDFKKRFGFDLRLGIGINTGVVNVGNMGSEQRFNYTVLGDSVNVASRVESCTKEFGATILTTQATLDAIRKADKSVPQYKAVAKTTLKGKSAPIDLFEIFEIEQEQSKN